MDELLRGRTIRELTLLYLASKYPDWVYYDEVIRFIMNYSKSSRQNIIGQILKCKRFGLIKIAKYGKTDIYYRITEYGLKWLRFKIVFEKKIPEELKVPAVDLVRIKVGGKII